MSDLGAQPFEAWPDGVVAHVEPTIVAAGLARTFADHGGAKG